MIGSTPTRFVTACAVISCRSVTWHRRLHNHLPDYHAKEQSGRSGVLTTCVVERLKNSPRPICAWNPARRIHFSRVEAIIKLIVNASVSFWIEVIQCLAPTPVIGRVWNWLYLFRLGDCEGMWVQASVLRNTKSTICYLTENSTKSLCQPSQPRNAGPTVSLRVLLWLCSAAKRKIALMGSSRNAQGIGEERI
jgi:hypothetical protein